MPQYIRATLSIASLFSTRRLSSGSFAPLKLRVLTVYALSALMLSAQTGARAGEAQRVKEEALCRTTTVCALAPQNPPRAAAVTSAAATLAVAKVALLSLSERVVSGSEIREREVEKSR